MPVKTVLAEAAVRAPSPPPLSPAPDVTTGKAASVAALVKAFARHSEESQLSGELAPSDRVVDLETSAISGPPAAQPRPAQPPAPGDGRTPPNRSRSRSPWPVVGLAVGAVVLVLLLYFLVLSGD
jgi:hypothetical protein